MAVTNFTPLLGLALPTTGDLSGTWGATVNVAITTLLDGAVAGTVTLSTDANVTLTTTNGADNQARNAIILCTGARTAIRTITAPAQSKLYVIINATTGGFGVKIVGAGPTTGITVLPGTQVMVAWNGTDFVVSSGDVVGPASATDSALVAFNGTTGKLVKSATLTANNVIIGNGTAAPLFVAPSTSGNVLTSNGTTWASSLPAAGGISYTSVKTANYTAVNNDGVLTNTTAAGFTVTFPASPAVGNQILVVDAFSQWGNFPVIVDPTGSQRIAGGTLGDTLTLDIAGATVTFVYTGSSYGWSVFAQVGGNGGTAVTLAGVQTITGTKSFTGTSSTLAQVLTNAAEVTTVSATAATGTINYDITTQSVLFFTTNASANFTVNFRASSGTSLNTALAIGQTVTAAFLVTNGATAFFNNVVQIDGVTITPKYQGGTAFTAGNATSIDGYTYTIVKTAAATFTVFMSLTKFA